jgi:fructose transport system permease protein
MVIGTLAIAQSLVILTAGIDLSVGALMLLSSVVMGRLAVHAGLPTWLALLGGLAVGTACGLLNGVLVTRFKLPPFIATLGTLSVFFALGLYTSQSETIRAQDVEAEASLLQWTANSFEVFGLRITAGVVLMIGLFALVWYILNWTSWGRHVYAVGNDPVASRLVGIRTDRVLLSIYVIAGLICGIAGWLFIGRVGAVTSVGITDANLFSITAVVIGGISLFGGRGSVLGALVGALIVGVFENGLRLAGLDVLWVQFSLGLLILAAVAMDHWIRKVTA